MCGSRHWLEGPCAFYVSRKHAAKCCSCDGPFGLVNGGRTCEFCGYTCHKSAGCSRKLWLARELLRRRICSQCDRYRKISSDLRRGADFTFHERAGSRVVSLSVDETSSSLLIQDKDTGQRLGWVGLSQIEVVRRGFSLGGRLRTSSYDPLRSLSLTVNCGAHDLTSYNLTAPSALACHRWVNGLQAAMYVHRRVEEQELAREWYQSHGRSLHATGNRILRNQLPSQGELSRLRLNRPRGKPPLSSLASNDSGVDSDEGSVEDLDILESYVDIELASSGGEIKSRDISYSSIFGKPADLSLSYPLMSLSMPSTSRSFPSSDIDIAGPASSLCSCHIHHQ